MAKELKKRDSVADTVVSVALVLEAEDSTISILPYHSDTALKQGLCDFRAIQTSIITRRLRIQRLVIRGIRVVNTNPSPLRLLISHLTANNRLLLGACLSGESM